MDYIRASLRHIDGWTEPAAQFLRVPVIEPKSLPAPLPKEIAVSEAVEALHTLWEERVPLSGGRSLWHVPVDGKTRSLFGLARGFSGVGVFCRAAAFLLAYRRGDPTALNQAGRLLAWMYDRKKKNGAYMVFREGRKQYFLPAFLQGNIGIASVMLSCAELS